MSKDIKREIFEICSQFNKPRYIYVEAYVRIEKSKDGNYRIAKVDSAWQMLADLEESELIESIMELDPVDVSSEGYYSLKGLFTAEYDSDDFRVWYYLGNPEIIEFEFQITFEEYDIYEQVINNFNLAEPFNL